MACVAMRLATSSASKHGGAPASRPLYTRDSGQAPLPQNRKHAVSSFYIQCHHRRPGFYEPAANTLDPVVKTQYIEISQPLIRLYQHVSRKSSFSGYGPTLVPLLGTIHSIHQFLRLCSSDPRRRHRQKRDMGSHRQYEEEWQSGAEQELSSPQAASLGHHLDYHK